MTESVMITMTICATILLLAALFIFFAWLAWHYDHKKY